MPNPYLAVAAIIVGVAILQGANGVTGMFLPLRMTAEHFPATAFGFVVTAHSLGFAVGCLLAVRIIQRVGHIRAFSAFAAAMSAVSLAFAIDTNPAWWTCLRILTGFCSAGLMTIAESWLNERTPNYARGRVIGVYMICNKLSFALGQLSLATGSVMGYGFLMISAAGYSLSLIPLAMSTSTSPPIPKVQRLGVRELYRFAPAAAVGCFATGLINTPVISIGPVYAAQLGWSNTTISVLMAGMQIGSLMLQWPLGWMSDKFDRRYVIVGSSAAVALISLALGLATDAPFALLLLLFAFWGGFALTIYAICIAHANDFAEPEQRVALSSTLLLAWASGSTVGPTLASLVMDQVGPGGLFLYCAVIAAVVTLFVLWRMTRRRAKPASERDRFVATPTTTPLVVPQLDPRSPERPDRTG